jgi:hypothetical protein
MAFSAVDHHASKSPRRSSCWWINFFLLSPNIWSAYDATSPKKSGRVAGKRPVLLLGCGDGC